MTSPTGIDRGIRDHDKVGAELGDVGFSRDSGLRTRDSGLMLSPLFHGF